MKKMPSHEKMSKESYSVSEKKKIFEGNHLKTGKLFFHNHKCIILLKWEALWFFLLQIATLFFNN